MREIKFRAWDKDKKGFWYFTFEDIFTEGCEGHLEAIADSKHLGLYPQWSLRDMPKTQYTGLTDKNGKEIFEGDVVAISEIVLINWDFIVSSPLLIEFRNYGWFPFAHGLPSPSELEIIGNIYQHPELLKEAA